MILGPRTPYTPQPGEPLTDREIEVLHRAALGYGSVRSGVDLRLSEHTVKTHMRKLFVKLVAHDRSHAVALGFQRGYLWVGADNQIHAGRSGQLLRRVA